jgi:acyl carrier protein
VSGEWQGGSTSAHDVIALIRDEEILSLDDGFGPDDDLFAAGLDSLALMQLLVAASERFGVMLQAGDVTRENLRTPESLARLLRRDSD